MSSSNSSVTTSNQTPLPALPLEVVLQITKYLSLPPQLCIKHVFDRCEDPWNCPVGGNEAHPNYLSPVQSGTYLGAVSKTVLREGLKHFFKCNLFVFNQPANEYLMDSSRNIDLSRFREARVMRMLRFFHNSDRVGHGAGHFQIRHLAFVLACEEAYSEIFAWDWPLKFDWATLPMLETLYLDLRAYSKFSHMINIYNFGASTTVIGDGAVRMKGLNLKTLVLVGLCSGNLWRDQVHKELMKTLFQPAVAIGGALEFWDSHEPW